MIYIIFGALIFLMIHMLTLYSSLRVRLLKKISITTYKLTFSIIATVGLTLLFYARFEQGPFIKAPNELVLNQRFNIMYLANLLITAAYFPKNHVKAFITHPMLIGVFLWSTTHLLINEHLNHLVMFASFSFFSIIMIIGITIRDRLKPKAVPHADYRFTIGLVVTSTLTYVLILLLHEYIAGVPLL